MAQNLKIRVFVVDDHPVVLDGLRSVLAAHHNIEIIGEATSGDEALQKVVRLVPDIVLMDISIPSESGLKVAQRLQDILPKIKVIAFTMHDTKEYVIESIRVGAKGYVLKDSSPDELIRAIEAVQQGDTYFSAKVSKLLLDQYVAHVASKTSEAELTSRETEILSFVASGLSTKEIAARLKISARTVDTHREKVMKKLDIHSAVGLTKYAVSKGIIKP